MAAEHRNAMVVAVRMAGQTAGIHLGLTAEAARTAGPAAGDIAVQVPPIAGRPVAVVGIAVQARLTADPAAVAVVHAEEAVVHAEEAAVHAEEAAVRIRPRHMVAVEGPIGKIVRAWDCPSRALPFTGYRFVSLGNDSDSTPTKFEPILRKLLKPGAEAREIRIQLAGAEELQQS